MANVGEFDLEDHILGTLYGNCIGDAIGLLTEFMIKNEAKKYYGEHKELEFEQKVPDMHRMRWKTGDWTDDSDQMILIIQAILEKGELIPADYGQRLINWARHGIPDFGDHGGMGIGATTTNVLRHENYKTDPHAASKAIWEFSNKEAAPNGGVMRTSVLGVYKYNDLDEVESNTLKVCKVTHYDPRCQASCVAVTTAIALMLQRDPKHLNKDGTYKVDAIMEDAYQRAKKLIPDKSQAKEFKKHMFARSLSDLKLDESGKIGYTLKCMGAGFWAFRQTNFRDALQKLTMEAGDADTNGAVAGALLGCKLGAKKLPSSWLNGLCYKDWLDKLIDRFLPLVIPDYKRKFQDEEKPAETSATVDDKSKEEKSEDKQS